MPRASQTTAAEETIENEQRYVSALGRLADELGRPPTVQEAVTHLKCGRQTVHHYLQLARRAYTWPNPTSERLWMFIADRPEESRRLLVGHALAQVLGISQASGEDIVRRLSGLLDLGFKETHLLLMLDARRKPSAEAVASATPPRPASAPVRVAAAVRTRVQLVAAHQCSMEIDE